MYPGRGLDSTYSEHGSSEDRSPYAKFEVITIMASDCSSSGNSGGDHHEQERCSSISDNNADFEEAAESLLKGFCFI